MGKTPEIGHGGAAAEPHLAELTPEGATARGERICLGIDVGVTGGIAVLSASGELLEVHPMPALPDGPAGRQAVNGPLLASIVFASHATQAFVELVASRPGEGAVGAFAFGRAKGVVEGVLAAAGIPCKFITPAAWKRAVGLPPGRDKNASRAAAIGRYPNQADLFKRKCDDGKAEAVLIAVAGLAGRH